MTGQLEAHGPYLAFLAFVVILGVVLTIAAFVDATRNHHRSTR